MSILWMIGGFILVLTPIVLVHELGHFWAARLSGVRIEEFGIGLPPRALTITERKGTIYSLNWIPLGGFVRPAGEDDPLVAGGLAAASKRARFFVLAAGAGANFVMAIVVFWLAFMVGTPAVAIDSVHPDSPAMRAGLQSGDVFLAVKGAKADDSYMIASYMHQYAGQPIELQINRNGQLLTIEVTPRLPDEYNPETDGPIGVTLTMAGSGVRITRGPVEAAAKAGEAVWSYIRLFFNMPGMIVRGEISASEARPVSIVGISQIAGQAAESSAVNRNLFPLLNIIAFINLALGLTNLLPIPALDGGRILFVLIEAVRGRRVEPEREGMVHIIGMLFLLGLMVLMVVQDIVNPIIPF